ncbi:MAG: hypothetical protein OHK0039_08650 [Bacteroidia bacterium]
MSRIINKLLLLGTALLFLVACEKDEVKLVIQPGAAPTLTINNTTLVLTEDQAAAEALKLTWSEADYGFQAAVKYIVQMDKADNAFADPIEFDVANALEKSITVGELNSKLLLKGLAPGSVSAIEVRVKSDVNPNVEPLYSSVTTLQVTPYLVVIDYPSLYVPGNYQLPNEWTPAAASEIVSVRGDNVYEGYVNFGRENTEFKFTDAPDWNNGIFGDEGDGTTGVIASPGNNFKAATAGYYLLRADLNANTWSATATNWGLIGSATPNGWDSDQDMTYDSVTDTWTITLNLVAGEIKFRANDDWGINFGDDGANGLLEYGGANIAVAEDGNYTVVLNLSIGGNYTFTVTKN